MRELTPYDTGQRGEPEVWVLGDQRRPREHEDDRYGKVDFTDDEGATICTVWVDRDPAVGYVVHIEPAAWRIAVEVTNDDEPASPITTSTTHRSSSATTGLMAELDEHSHDL